MESFSVRTSSKTEFKDITDRVRSIVQETGVEEGECIVYVPHTTAAVTIVAKRRRSSSNFSLRTAASLYVLR